MNRREWSTLFAKYPPGLSGAELARQVKQHPQVVAYWIKRLKYQSVDGRKSPPAEKFSKLRKVNSDDIDFSESNNAILARRHGVSRNRIWQLRHAITKI